MIIAEGGAMSAELFSVLVLIALVLSIAGIGFSLLLLRRNGKVCRYRLRMVDRVGALAEQDITAGRDWEWRYKALEEVPYGQMLYRFWRPFDSFYEGNKCLSE